MVTDAPVRVPVDTIWEWLGDVSDPEVPAVSVVDLGIVRDVAWIAYGDAPLLQVTVTPTYTGCPATRVIANDIVTALRARGVGNVRIRTELDPPWTTDRLSERAREKLRAYGIAPPRRGAPIACPRCASVDTACVSRFGSTPCKALYRCNACREPFDHFKCH